MLITTRSVKIIPSSTSTVSQFICAALVSKIQIFRYNIINCVSKLTCSIVNGFKANTYSKPYTGLSVGGKQHVNHYNFQGLIQQRQGNR